MTEVTGSDGVESAAASWQGYKVQDNTLQVVCSHNTQYWLYLITFLYHTYQMAAVKLSLCLLVAIMLASVVQVHFLLFQSSFSSRPLFSSHWFLQAQSPPTTVKLHIFGASSVYWLAVKPMQDNAATASIEMKDSSSSSYIPMVSNADWGYYSVSSSGMLTFCLPDCC